MPNLCASTSLAAVCDWPLPQRYSDVFMHQSQIACTRWRPCGIWPNREGKVHQPIGVRSSGSAAVAEQFRSHLADRQRSVAWHPDFPGSAESETNASWRTSSGRPAARSAARCYGGRPDILHRDSGRTPTAHSESLAASSALMRRMMGVRSALRRQSPRRSGCHGGGSVVILRSIPPLWRSVGNLPAPTVACGLRRLQKYLPVDGSPWLIPNRSSD